MCSAYSDDAAAVIIRQEYEGENPWLEAPSLRSGSRHEETPVDGRVWCDACGLVEKPTADPKYHPEQYVDDVVVT